MSNQTSTRPSSTMSSLTLNSVKSCRSSVTLLVTSSSLTIDSIDKKVHVQEVEHDQVDGGRNAWVFLLGAFMVEGLIYGILCLMCLYFNAHSKGFPLLFGVFQRYYESNGAFGQSKFLPVVGTVSVVSFTALSLLWMTGVFLTKTFVTGLM
jgi:hypothetical protein